MLIEKEKISNTTYWIREDSKPRIMLFPFRNLNNQEDNDFLVDGIVDYLEKFNIKVFGPNKIASQLEGSKIFTKKLCEKFNIPTAKFGIFYNKLDAKKFTETINLSLIHI